MVRVAWLGLFFACAPIGGTSGQVLGPGPELARQRCQQAQAARVVVAPLFVPGPSDTGPIVTLRGDGVLVTTAAGRFHLRHERGGNFLPYVARYFENRSFQVVIEDAVPAGRSEVKVSFLPVADVSTGAQTQFRHWKTWGPAGNVGGAYQFQVNVPMSQSSLRSLFATTTFNQREQRVLALGDLFDFELGLYLAGADAADPNPVDGVRAGFSETFRYRVGVGGLTAQNFDSDGLLGPTPNALSGGATTSPTTAWADGGVVDGEFSFEQPALNIQQPHLQRFLEGRQVFHSEFDTGANVEPGNPALPQYAGLLRAGAAAKSCEGCHPHSARGSTAASFEASTSVTLADGVVVTLRRPTTAAPRVAPPLIGLGLLEALDEETVLAAADEDDCDGDGISGRAMVSNGQLGRFGWAASSPSVDVMVRAQLADELGVTLAAAELERLDALLRLPGLVPQREGTIAGAEVFGRVGCAACHLPQLTTGQRHPMEELRGQVIRPFTDLLLHELGSGLADGSTTEWRTSPLWGLGVQSRVSAEVRLLHDGRAGSVLEAILWHGGEAEHAKAAVVALSTVDRAALLAFVDRL